MWFAQLHPAVPRLLISAAWLCLLLIIGNHDSHASENFVLQLLHLSDQEAGAPAVEDAPRLSAVLGALRAKYPENTLLLSSGDAYIAGPFFEAGSDTSLIPLLGTARLGDEGEADTSLSRGRTDILIQNALGVQAIAIGNHEFDAGPNQFAALLAANADGSYAGARFPYLSSNIDFSTIDELAARVVPNGQPASSIPNSLTASTTLSVAGETLGVVAATTPNLANIASTGSLVVSPPDPADIPALAAIIQHQVDQLTANGMNKIILLTHMQQISIEAQLATLLKDVDIIVGGGSNTILADHTDRLRAGDTAEDSYPLALRSASGEPIYVVNTDGNYRYLGRLVVEFDDQGLIIGDAINATESGAYATDEQALIELGNPAPIQAVVDLANAISEVLVARESNQFGQSLVYLEGRRSKVRTEETNLGNLSADANLFIAQQFNPATSVSLKNGGSIRDDIGEITYPTGTNDPDARVFLPPPAIPQAGKEKGEISEFDISNSLRFNNGLAVLTVTAAGLQEIVEHAVAASAEGATPGQFPQVGGIHFSFDPSLPPNARVRSLVVLDNNGAQDGGELDVLVQDGKLLGDPGRSFTLVTLDFLAGWDSDTASFDPDGNGSGGDSYPFPALAQGDIVRLIGLPELATGMANFADPGSEQDALAEYLQAVYPPGSAYKQAETGPTGDLRIQNLNQRADSVIP